MNYRMITSIIGRIMCVEAVFMLPAVLISLYQGETDAVWGFSVTILLLLALGGLAILQRPKRTGFYAREGLVTVGFVWIVVSLFGALPFFISGAIPNYVDCIFETVSGFTTTGASILKEVEVLPMGLLYWRSFTHWLGGMGVLVFLLAFAPLTKDSANGDSMHLLRAESPGINVGKLVPRMHRSAKILYEIYLVLTLLQVILLLIGGISLFDAVTISFGTAGTGGFAVKNDSLMGYSHYIQGITTVFMLLFAVNFNIYFLLLLREFKKVITNEELRAYAIIVAVSIVAIAVNIVGMYGSIFEAFHQSAFQVASVISTTGFSTTNFDLWPSFSKVILVLLMFIGACAGSTGGGIKVVRLVVLLKAAKRSIYEALHPNSISLINMDGEVLDDKAVSSIQSFTLIYLLLTGASVLLICVDGFDLVTNFTAVVACISNIGPGLAEVGPIMNFCSFSEFSKIILTICMLLGRLELYPMLILFIPSAWKK